MPQINITVDWETTHLGYAPMGIGLPQSFLEGENITLICSTIAMLAMQPEPEMVRPHPQALATLALYAGGAQVTLTRQQFRRLERRVVRYLRTVGGVSYFGTKNYDFARFVLDRALARAKLERVI